MGKNFFAGIFFLRIVEQIAKIAKMKTRTYGRCLPKAASSTVSSSPVLEARREKAGHECEARAKVDGKETHHRKEQSKISNITAGHVLFNHCNICPQVTEESHFVCFPQNCVQPHHR